jgi:hypothetical protein
MHYLVTKLYPLFIEWTENSGKSAIFDDSSLGLSREKPKCDCKFVNLAKTSEG